MPLRPPRGARWLTWMTRAALLERMAAYFGPERACARPVVVPGAFNIVVRCGQLAAPMQACTARSRANLGPGAPPGSGGKLPPHRDSNGRV